MANTYKTGNSTVSTVQSSNTFSGFTAYGKAILNAGGGGSSGSLLTSVGINGTSWTNPSTNFYSSNQTAILTIPHGEEKVVLAEKATLEVKGTVKINGIDLEERLKTIEKVLMIPERDAIMETKYPSLKKKYDEYIKELSKYRMWESIKGNEND